MGALDDTGSLLGLSAGYMVEAEDGVVGRVETPLFPAPGGAPDFLVLFVRDRGRTRRPVVPTVLVEEVDSNFRIVRVRGRRKQISHFPEHLPLAI